MVLFCGFCHLQCQCERLQTMRLLVLSGTPLFKSYGADEALSCQEERMGDHGSDETPKVGAKARVLAHPGQGLRIRADTRLRVSGHDPGAAYPVSGSTYSQPLTPAEGGYLFIKQGYCQTEGSV